jgi:AcrR family transcriptional regulator
MIATPEISGGPRRGQRSERARRGDRTAARILDAAEALFAERGYAGTTLREVAAQVGVRNPSLYNHFPSKESLYAAVLERGIDPLLAALSEFAEAGDRDARESRRLVERTMALLRQRPNLPRLIQHEALSGGRHLSPLLRERIRPIFVRARETIEASPAARRWDADQIPLLVLALYHVVVGYFTIASLYEALGGADLLSERALADQTRFLGDLVATLFERREVA